MKMPSDKDIVVEARERLARNRQTHRIGRLIEVRSGLLRALANEVERLRRGDFTAEEFQNLCHNTDVQAGFDAFADGCEAYQQKLFGRCRTKGKVL